MNFATLSKDLLASFSLVSWGGVRLTPLGMAATIWSIVPGQDDK
jgi:hypothetical protein